MIRSATLRLPPWTRSSPPRGTDQGQGLAGLLLVTPPVNHRVAVSTQFFDNPLYAWVDAEWRWHARFVVKKPRIRVVLSARLP